MRIPLAEFAHSVPFCQGVSAVLPRGTNIGYVSVLGLRFVFAIIRWAKSPRPSRYVYAYSLKTLEIIAKESGVTRVFLLNMNIRELSANYHK